MPINWTEIVQPNYLLIMPELVLIGTMLIGMIVDLYMKEKRLLVWLTMGGVLLALGSVLFVATDPGIQQILDSGETRDFFGGMIAADAFSFFMKAVVLGIAALLIPLSIDYVEKFLRGMYLEFYGVALSAVLGMMLMVGSRDLIGIYIGLELSSISSYILAGLLRHDPKSNEASLKYFLNGALASAVLLFGLSLIYGVTGSTYLPEIGQALGEYAARDLPFVPMIAVGVTFLVAGFGFKIAAAPMHLWAPDTYEGSPTPVTGFFSVGPKAAAFGAILRIFVVGLGAAEFASRWTVMWAVLAAVSMLIGNLTALMQTNVKRMMAYSSIAQAGYILVGVVAAGSHETGAGTAAVLYYVLAYALTNLGIFAVLTHMDQEGGWVEVKDFNGLAQRNPVYAWALLLFFVSLIGIPPTVGFMGKFFLFNAAVETGYLWLALLMAVNSVISVGYYYGMVRAMFLEPAEKPALQASGSTMATVVVSFIGVILVAILASPFIGYTESAAALFR